LRRGDVVQLRTPAEIRATLDERGCLDGLPFMPEMLGFFGRQFTVSARVERACDTIEKSGVRRIRDTVLLDELRCDGSGHAGCQAQCRLYWKERWLRPATGSPTEASPTDQGYGELERLVRASARDSRSTDEQPAYRCQATELLRASEPVAMWSIRSFIGEVTSGNVRVWRFLRVMARAAVGEIGHRLRVLSTDQRAFTDQARDVPATPPAPPGGLELGTLVRVRSRAEIAPTIDSAGKNRGLWFDREMLAFCGRTARVQTKVERFIDERTGRPVELASDCYILEGFVCSSEVSEGRWFCPRAIYPWWREAWLERVERAPRGAAHSLGEREAAPVAEPPPRTPEGGPGPAAGSAT
jgi:hypothetical protein